MKIKRDLAAVILAVLCLVALAGIAGADEQIKGKIKSIDLETRTVIVTTYEKQDVTITISADDIETLKRLKEKRLIVEDDVKVKYVNKDGKNVATFFRKTSEC